MSIATSVEMKPWHACANACDGAGCDWCSISCPTTSLLTTIGWMTIPTSLSKGPKNSLLRSPKITGAFPRKVATASWLTGETLTLLAGRTRCN